jgi:hypothetical protein
MRNAYRILGRKPEKKRKHRQEENTKINLKELVCGENSTGSG